MSLTVTQHTAQFSTCGQISPEHVAAIKEAGYRSIINNRPDGEGGPDQPSSASIAQAAAEAGLSYFYIPVTAGQYPDDKVQAMAQALREAPQPIFCFCRSGARSTQLYQLALSCA